MPDEHDQNLADELNGGHYARQAMVRQFRAERINQVRDAAKNARQDPLAGAKASLSKLKEDSWAKPKEIWQRYKTDLWFKAEVSLNMSCAINTVYACYQGVNAFARNSLWFGVLAVYYLLLTAMRLTIVRYLYVDASDGRQELRRYRSIGVFLLTLGGIVIAMGELANRFGNHPNYPGSMVIFVGIYAVYAVVNSIVDVVRYRKIEDPTISATKAIAVANALISLYSVSTALVVYFDGALRLVGLRQVASIAMPILVFLGIAAISITMIARATWALNSIKK